MPNVDRNFEIGEPPVVTAVRDLLATRLTYEAFQATFEAATIYALRPKRPGVFVTDIPGRGRWTLVFSQLKRLALHAGESDYLAATGADVLELVPDGVGIMLDPDDEHRCPVLTRMASAGQVAAAWRQLER